MNSFQEVPILSQPLKPSLSFDSPTYDPENVRAEDQIFKKWSLATDEDEKNLLLDKLGRLVYKHALAISWQILRQKRDDVANEVLEAVLRQIQKFKHKSKFSTWVQAIAQNIANRKLKQFIKRKNDISLSDTEMPLATKDIETEVIPRIQIEQVKKKLSEEEQKLLDMLLEGLGPTEIGAHLRLSANTVSTRWTRLKEKMKKELSARKT